MASSNGQLSRKLLAAIVGRLRAKIVHFFDKSVKIGTGVV